MAVRKIVILDLSTVEVHVFPYDEAIWESAEDFLPEHYSNDGKPFKESECSWMLTNGEGDDADELPIYLH